LVVLFMPGGILQARQILTARLRGTEASESTGGGR